MKTLLIANNNLVIKMLKLSNSIQSQSQIATDDQNYMHIAYSNERNRFDKRVVRFRASFYSIDLSGNYVTTAWK